MHTIFEWDDSIAGQKYREQQARILLSQLVFNVEEKSEQTIPLRVFVSSGQGTKEYEPIKLVIKDENKAQKLLEQAYTELRAFKKKYSVIRDLLDEVINFDLIE